MREKNEDAVRFYMKVLISSVEYRVYAGMLQVSWEGKK